MKKVLILTSSEGHVSIAQAIAQRLRSTYAVAVSVYKSPEFSLYLPIYQLFPSLFKFPYKLAEYERARDFAKKLVKQRYGKIISTMIEREKPDYVISTYLFYDQLCADYGKEHHISTLNVIANPRTIHPLETCTDSRANLVFDTKAVKTLRDYGVEDDKILETGWFVREQFRPATDKNAIRKKLHLLEQPLTLLFSAGSDGSSTILKILPLFFQVQTPVQVVFVCGNNTSLYRSLRLFIKTFHFANQNSPVRFTVLRFVENMHEYIQASDLVVGKAGPNSLFEAVACHVPFFAITHISGQEDGNLELIEEQQLGLVEENPLRAISKLKEIIANPVMLRQFQPALVSMATKNEHSGEMLLQLLNRL